MKLLTEEIRRRLPPFGSQDGKGGKAAAQLKLFTPTARWSWFATEFDGKDLFFGLVDGMEKELGYFTDCSIITESFALAVARFQAKNEETWQNNRGQNDSDLDPILAYDFAHNHFA